MNFYDQIRSPFEDEETIKELINIFSKRQDKLYYDITHNSGNEKIDANAYMEQFDANIFWPFTENDWKSYTPSEEERDTYSKFKSFEELWNYTDQFDSNIQKALSNYFHYSRSPEQAQYAQKSKRELQEISGKADEIIKATSLMKKILKSHTYHDENIMGFHFDSQLHDKTPKRETPEVKFYINAGEDSYKVAKLFLDKCREQNMESYYFKVVDPMYKEQSRTDKLCIYSTVEHAKSFLEIIRQIKIENPNINFNKPPLTTGVIDNFIGFGTDTLDNDLSYNQTIAEVVEEGLREFFSKMNVEYSQAFEYIKQNPDMLKQIRQVLIQKSVDKGCSKDKICITENIAKKLKTIELSTTMKKDNGRMQFVQRFLDLYDNTETEYQQETRLELESGSIQRVLDIVGKKDMQISDLIDVRYIDIDETGEKRPEYTAKQFSAMARLLKAAEGLNNDKDVNPNGLNYLEQFTAVPQIKNILLAMSQDFKYEGTYLHQLRDEYKKSKSVGDISDSSSLEEVSDDDTTVSHKLYKTMGTTYKQRAQKQAKTSSQSFRDSVASKTSRTIPQKAQTNKTASQSFRESIAKDTTKQGVSEESQQQTKTSSQSFRDSLYKARSTEKTGITDIKKSQKDIGLRTERGNLIRQSLQGQLDEDGKRRLEEINRLLNIKNVNVQQFEANKRRQGQSR